MKKPLFAGLLAVSLACGAISSHADISNEDRIKIRQSAYQFASWNMGKIKQQVIDGTVDFNPASIQAAADAIAAVANSGMGALYTPGTDQGSGWKPTRLKAEFFQQPEKAREVGGNFVRAANKMQEVAKTADKAAIARQFGELGQSCKACHDSFRSE